MDRDGGISRMSAKHQPQHEWKLSVGRSWLRRDAWVRALLKWAGAN